MTDALSRQRRGRIVGVLHRLGRTPEPMKRCLRVGFVAVVRLGARLPGMRRAAVHARYRLPETYQWFAEHYEAYRILRHDPTYRSVLPVAIATKLCGIRSAPPIPPVTPPEYLSNAERQCFARLAFAANSRRKRVLW